MDKHDMLKDLDNDTLAKISLAATAGLLAVAGGKKIYKKYRENKLLKKYTGSSQEDLQYEKHRNVDVFPDIALNIIDAQKLRK